MGSRRPVQQTDYCYAHLMRGTSAKEKLQTKEAYTRLESTDGDRFFAYRADK